MVATHWSDNAPIKEPLGVAFRGGPVNGPFTAAAAVTIAHTLAERGIRIAHVYGVSAGAPTAAMIAVGREAECEDIWMRLTPGNIIDVSGSWMSKAMTMGRLLLSESIFRSTGLELIINSTIRSSELYSRDALPVSIMTVDYDTGDPLVFTNTDPAFYPVFPAGVLGSMALTPFMRLHQIWAGPKGLATQPQTPEDFCVRLMDGGYRDNLMVEYAARDGINTLLVVDINGLQIARSPEDGYKYWAGPLQMAFHTLITTNDQRNLYGATRVNEELAIRDELAGLVNQIPEEQRAAVTNILARMDHGRLELAKKHNLHVHLIEDHENVIPFDFANFTHQDVLHLVACGRNAATRTLEALR